MAPKGSPRAGVRLVPRTRMLSDYQRRKEFEKRMAELKCEEAYRAGHRSALALGIALCVDWEQPLPHWIGAAWKEACAGVAMRKIGSWDEVLGNTPPETSGQQRREQQKLAQAMKLREALQRLGDVPMTDGKLFEALARETGISQRTVRRMYTEEFPAHWKRSDLRRGRTKTPK